MKLFLQSFQIQRKHNYEGWKRTGTFPLTFTFADKRSGCYGNGLIDVAEKFEFGACSIWIDEDVGRVSFLFPTYLSRKIKGDSIRRLFMREILCSILKVVYLDSWSGKSFVSTCDVFNCLFPLDVQNEIQLLSRVFSRLFMAGLFIGFLVEKCVACQNSVIRLRMAAFSFFALLNA